MSLPIIIQQDHVKNQSYQWLIRSLAVFSLIVVVPLDYKFWIYVFEDGISFYTLFKLTNYAPHVFGSNAYLNIGFLIIVSLITGFIWKGQRVNYSNLYYWARVLLRYRLGIILVAYGLLKLFPLQMPFPSLSNLHTNYGDFYGWKIYYHTTGITPWYESFLGLIELLAGLLLFFRKTTTLGAGVIIGFTGNIFAANLAYQGGQEYLSLLILFVASILFIYDANRLFLLLYKFEVTKANTIIPIYDQKWIKRRLIFKSVIALYLIFIGVLFAFSWSKAPFKYPEGKALSNLYGYYNVKSFKFNGVELPYSKTDSVRWQNVVFEKWPTISFVTGKPIIVDNTIPNDYRKEDLDRTFESAGVGGRRYFHYDLEEGSQIIKLLNKNPHHKDEKFELKYIVNGDSTILLSGKDNQGNIIEAVLNKVEKKYMLLEGRRKPVKL
jgi:hypothetical protein